MQLAIVVLLGTNKGFRVHTSLASTIVSMATTISLAVVSDLEHVRTIRPSFLIQTFFFFAILCDLPRVRTQWFLPNNTTVAAIFSVTFGLKVIVMFVESVHKFRHSIFADQPRSPEDYQGVFGRTFFTWLLPLFFDGFKRNLSMDDLFVVDDDLTGQILYERLNKHWLKGASFRHFFTIHSLCLYLGSLASSPD